MAIPHFSFKGISKGNNQSVIASSSYMARKKMKDKLETDPNKRIKKSFTSSKDHYLTLMMLPSGAPVEYNDPETCWNDLHAIEKNREAVRFLLTPPKELTKEQAIELSKEWAYQEFVSKGLVVQLSFHNEKDGNGNFHCHGLGSYRQLVNGKWADVKSRKAYVDENGEPLEKVDTPKLKNGKLQYNKDGSIKTVKGWQRLMYDDKTGKPLLHDDGTPVLKDIRIPVLNEDGSQRTTNNGKHKKLSWKERKIQITDLEKRTAAAEARKLWQDVQNDYFRKHNILDEKGNVLQVDLRSYAEQDKDKPEEEKRIPTQHQGIGPAAELIAEENQQIMQRRADLAKKKELEQKVAAADKLISDYVEKEIQPENLFVTDYAQPYHEAVKLKDDICSQAQTVLAKGVERTAAAVAALQKKESLSDREQAKLELLQKNETSWNTCHETVDMLRQNTKHDTADNYYKKVWRGLTGWQRYKYISRRSKRKAEIYKTYLIRQGDFVENPEQKLPGKVSLDKAMSSVLAGKAAPSVNANIDKALPVQQEFDRIAASTLSAWDTRSKGELHLPPTAKELEIINVVENVPNRFKQLADKKELRYHSIVPKDYHPEQDYQNYLGRIRSIDEAEHKAEEARKEAERIATERREAERKAEQERLAAEARRRAWSRAEYDRLAAIRDAKLKKLRIAIMRKTAKAEYQKQLEDYNDYTEIKQYVDSAYQEWKNFEKAEATAKEEHENKNSIFSLYKYEYNTDYAEINRLKERYMVIKKKQDELFPTTPKKPNINVIIRDIKQRLGKRQANLLIKDAANLQFKDKDLLISEYDKAAKAAREYWKKKPDDDPASGKHIQQPKQNTNADRRAANTPTVAPPDRKKGKGRGGRS